MPHRCGIWHAGRSSLSDKIYVIQYVGALIETSGYLFPDKHSEVNKNSGKLIALLLKDVDTEIDRFGHVNAKDLPKTNVHVPYLEKIADSKFVCNHIFS